MDYLINFIFRLIFLIVVLTGMFTVMLFFVVIVQTIWDFKFKKHLNEFTAILDQPFDEECIEYDWDHSVKTYWITKTPLDYLLNRKTYIDNPNYVERVVEKKTKKITAKQVKQKVQDTLDDIKL